MCLCIPSTFTVHVYSTVMALLCIPVIELVFLQSLHNICPFIIQRLFHLLVSTLFFTCIQQISCHIHYSLLTIAALALPTCSNIEGLELVWLPTINGTLLRKKMCCRIALCSTSHEALYVVTLMWGYSLMNAWVGHGSISIDSLVKG